MRPGMKMLVRMSVAEMLANSNVTHSQKVVISIFSQKGDEIMANGVVE
jgi:hypothetical protein